MLVSVLMGKENDFKSILAFYEHFTNNKGLMKWSISETGFFQKALAGDESSATDGDLDAAYALLLAGEPKGAPAKCYLGGHKPHGAATTTTSRWLPPKAWGLLFCMHTHSADDHQHQTFSFRCYRKSCQGWE